MQNSSISNDETAANIHSDFSEVHFSASDGLSLYARDYGRDNADTAASNPVVCLPGLTRNSADFHKLALHLSQNDVAPRRIICFDYRGRGNSAWDKEKTNYNILVEADDVLAGCAALGVKHADFIGTSRGALIIMALAAIRPAVLSAVVLNDCGPVIEGAGLAQILAYQDRLKSVKTLAEAADAFKALQGGAFSALADEDWHDQAASLFAMKGGKLKSNFDPAIIEMLRDVDLNTPLPTLWPQFDGLIHLPMLVIRGANSSLLSTKTVEEMAEHHPGMQHVEVEGQGHAPMLHIGALPDIIYDFLQKAAHQ